jgi:hypothetical protein
MCICAAKPVGKLIIEINLFNCYSCFSCACVGNVICIVLILC